MIQRKPKTQAANLFREMGAAIAALAQNESELEKAAQLLAQAAQRNALIHVFGVDARAADLQGELFFRPGGLACINPIYDPAFSNSHGAYRSELCRTMEGLTPCILEYYETIEQGDPIVLLTLDADSIAFHQAAVWARNKGLVTIAVLPVPPQASETDCLLEAAVCVGQQHTTLCMAAALNALLVQTVQLAPEAAVWTGDFLPDLQRSKETIDAYLFKIRHL